MCYFGGSVDKKQTGNCVLRKEMMSVIVEGIACIVTFCTQTESVPMCVASRKLVIITYMDAAFPTKLSESKYGWNLYVCKNNLGKPKQNGQGKEQKW